MKSLIVALAFLLCPVMALAEKVALIIGNSAYTAVATLDNPLNDSAAVAAALTQQGFDVMRTDDLDRNQMYDALRTFRNMADKAEFALVYYAGHGIEVGGKNFLVPVDARLEDERDASVEMISLDVVMRQISGASLVKMVILDACRNNPFVTKMKRENTGRNVGVGLGNIQTAQADTLIAYAAAAGEITPDGVQGGNSPFTQAFVTALHGPPADVRRLLGKVRDEMRLSVPGAAPFVYSSLGGNEYIINPNGARPEPKVESPPPAPPATPTVIATDPAPGGESILADFASADRKASADTWDAFLVKYRALNYHLLYALALEKRDAMRATASVPLPTGSDADQANAALPNASASASASASEMPTEPDTVRWQEATLPRTRPEAAKAIQTILGESGCYSGPADGIFGKNSRAGLARYSEQAGILFDTGTSPSLIELQGVLVALSRNPGFECSPVITTRRQPAAKQASTPPRVTTAPAASRPPPEQSQPQADAPPFSYAGRGGQQLGRTEAAATSSGSQVAPVTSGGRSGQQLPRNK